MRKKAPTRRTPATDRPGRRRGANLHHSSRRSHTRSSATRFLLGRSLCLLKMLCLNGKIREGRSTLPRDPLPPPKRDGQAFAESSANASDDAHRGREYLATATTTLHRRPIRIDFTCQLDSCACGLCLPTATALRGTLDHLKPSQAVDCKKGKLRYSSVRSRSLIAPYCAHSMLEAESS